MLQSNRSRRVTLRPVLQCRCRRCRRGEALAGVRGQAPATCCANGSGVREKAVSSSSSRLLQANDPLPVVSSLRITPRAQTSVAGPTGLPIASRSGAMYAGVPTTSPAPSAPAPLVGRQGLSHLRPQQPLLVLLPGPVAPAGEGVPRRPRPARAVGRAGVPGSRSVPPRSLPGPSPGPARGGRPAGPPAPAGAALSPPAGRASRSPGRSRP
jgi:hypothetical protein